MHYRFRVDPLVAALVEGNGRLCRRLMAIKDPKSFDDESAKQKLWDGLLHFFDQTARTIPAGLLHRLTKRLEARGHTVAVEYDQPPEEIEPIPPDYLVGANMDGDRAYQLDAVNSGLELRRGIWWLATNAGKCIVAGMKIQMADGSLVPIEQIRAGDLVVSADADGDLRFKSCRVAGVVCNGVKDVLDVIVCGRRLRCTGNHPFLTSRGGWTQAKDLKPGDLVALPREVPFFGSYDPPDHEVKVLAYMLAEGGLTAKYGYGFTNASSVIVDDFVAAVECFAGSTVNRDRGCAIQYRIVNSRAQRGRSRALDRCGAQDFIAKSIGATHARDKKVPAWVFQLTEAKLALFLKCFMSCDGHVAKRSVEVGLASQQLTRDVADLLVRFGVHGGLREKLTNFGTKAYVFTSHGRDSVVNFMRRVGSFNLLHHRNADIQEGCGPSKHDRIPVTAHVLSRTLTSALARTLGRKRLRTGASLLTRSVAETWADVSAEMRAYARSDLSWQPVHAVRPAGREMTYDIEVAGLHNFLAEGLLVHNSYCIAAFTGRLARAGKKCLVIVPNKFLVHQTSKDIHKLLGPDVVVGIAGDGIRELKCDILVATYQTLMKGLAKWSKNNPDKGLQWWMENCEAVVCDEAHHAASNVLTAILKRCANAEWRIGCTGTVDKKDKQGLSDKATQMSDAKATEHRWRLESYLGPVIARVTNAELIEKGISAKPTIVFVDDFQAYGPPVATPCPHPGEEFSATSAYNEVFAEAAIHDKRFRATVAKIAAEMLEQGKAPWVFSHSVKQLVRLKVTFDRFGIPCELVTGKHGVPIRNAMVKRFTAQGNFAVLVSTWSDEGASIPAIKGCILAGARKAPIEILQRIGRSVRKKTDGENAVTVVDFTMLSSSMLMKHWAARRAAYQHEGFDMVRLGDMNALSSVKF